LQSLKRLRWLAYLLDSLIRLPGGRRIGLDGIIGLIPGIGDAAGAIFAAYIVAEAARLGAPTTTLARMIYNLGLDALVGAVPLLGDLFDFVWKANSKNIDLLEAHVATGRVRGGGNRRLMMLLVGLLIAIVVGIAVLAYFVIRLVMSLLGY
jgi:hypothetical protein